MVKGEHLPVAVEVGLSYKCSFLFGKKTIINQLSNNKSFLFCICLLKEMAMPEQLLDVSVVMIFYLPH